MNTQFNNSNNEIQIKDSEINTENKENNIKRQISEISNDIILSKNNKTKIPWYKNPKYIILLIRIILSIILGGLIILIIVFLTENSKQENIEEDTYNFTYNISSLFFNSSKEEIITTIIEEKSDSNERKFKEKKNIKLIESEYLFTIVSIPNENNNSYYTGYIIILSRNEYLNGKLKKHLNESNNILNTNTNFQGIIQVKFNNNGTIVDRLFQNDLNDLYMNEINETISCLIPKLINQRNLDQINNETVFDYGIIDENNSWVSNSMNGKLSLDDDILIYSKYDSNLNITVQNKTLIQSVLEKKFLIQNDENKNFSSIDNNIEFMNDINDDLFYLNSLIQSIEIVSKQTLKYQKNEGNKLALKYKNKLSQLDLKSETNFTFSNRIIILSNQEYEEKLKKKHKKNFNNLRNLFNFGDITDSISYPLEFKYELFRTNIVGIQFSLNTIIEWIPTEGTIIFKLSYQKGEKLYDLDKFSLYIENYEKIIKSMKTVVFIINNNISNQIKKNFIELSHLLNNYLISYETKLKTNLESISLLYNDYFKSSLDNFKSNIFEYDLKNFDNLLEEFNSLTTFENIENLLNNGNEINFNNLISLKETELNNLINNYNLSLINLLESMNNLIDISIDTLNGFENDKKIGINFYYNFKEIFYKIDEIMNSFYDNLITALDSEFLQLDSYINNDIYIGEINKLLKDVEFVWNDFKNNEILKEKISSESSEIIISKLENIRKKYEDIKNIFLNKTKESYNNLKNNSIYNKYKEIQNAKILINNKQQTLINLIESKIIKFEDCKIYYKDIMWIIKFENDISSIILNSYETYINNKLNEKTYELILNLSSFNSIKNEIEIEVEILKNNLKTNDENKFKENYNNISLKLTEISSSKNIENIIKQIKSNFSSNYLNTLIYNYYKNVENEISKKSNNILRNINSDEDDEIGIIPLVPAGEILLMPDEMDQKINRISKNSENNIIIENDKLNNLVNEKMKNILNNIIYNIKIFLKSEINYVKANINSFYLNSTNKLKINSDFHNNSLNLIYNLSNNISNYLTLIESSFDLNKLSQNFENQINLTIRKYLGGPYKYIDELDYLLLGNDTDNETKKIDNKRSNYEIDDLKYYNLNVSLIKVIFYHLKLLQTKIDDVFNVSNINEITFDFFINKYKKNENLNTNFIILNIRNYIDVLKNEELKIIQSNVDSLKEIIKNGFISGFNLSEIICESFFKNLINIENLEENFYLLFINIQKIAKEGLIKDLNYYNDIEFYFDKTNMESEFNNTWNKCSKLFNEKKQIILNNLTLTDEFNKLIFDLFEEKIYNYIDDYQKELFLNITTKKCLLLNNEIVLTQVINDAIIELKNNISFILKNVLSSQIETSLNNYKNLFDLYFKDLHDKIKNQYKYLFDIYYNKMSQKSSISINKISKLTNGILNGFENGINLCLMEIENLFENNNITKYNDDDEEKITKEILTKISFRIPNILENINININNLNLICDYELKREKDSFKKEILENIKMDFNNTVINFLTGSGKFYLDRIFSEYEFNITHKLNYIFTECKEIDEYLLDIIQNLENIDSYIIDSVNNIYDQLINYISNKFSLEIINNTLFTKINQLKFYSAEKIVDNFNTYILNIFSSDLFLNILSEEIKDLLPSYIPYPLSLNFSIIFKELLETYYLSNFKQNFQNKYINISNYFVEEIQKLKNNIILQMSKLEQKTEDDIYNINNEYNVLNMKLNNIRNNFDFDLTDDKKILVNNIFLNSSFKKDLINIPIIYNNTFIQNSINNKLNINLSNFNTKIKELSNFFINDNPYEQFELIKNEFFNNFSLLFMNLKDKVEEDYSAQTDSNSDILPINKKRRLEENIEIENDLIQSYINLIDIQIVNLIQNISNCNGIIQIFNELNLINNTINIQLINLNNTLKTYLNYLKMSLKSTDNLVNFQEKITNINNEVENNLKNLFEIQKEKINIIYENLNNNNYKTIYYNQIKPDIIKKINTVIKDINKNLIENYLIDDIFQKNYSFPNTTDINIFEKNNYFILGSNTFNFSINFQNITIQSGYNLTSDSNNGKVYLEIFSSGYADFSMSLSNEYYKTLTEGRIGKRKFGMNIENNFLINRVFIDYYIKNNNVNIKKTLYEVNSLKSFESCNNNLNYCSINNNNNYCPFYLEIENENSIILPNDYNLSNNNNSNIYIFTGFYDDNLCYYTNYLYEKEDIKHEYNSLISKTV